MNNDRLHPRTALFRRLCPALAAFAATLSAQAHPGHGLLEAGPLHTVTSPDHLAILALLGAALFAGAHFTRKTLPRRTLQTLGTLAIVVSGVLWGLRV